MKYSRELAVAAVIGGSILLATVIIAVTLIKLSQPYGFEEWREAKEEGPQIERIEQPPVATPDTDLVQHPITGEWVTKEETEREKEILRAILCNQGRTEYCK